MNRVNLIGRLTRDPELKYGAGNQTAVARFSIAIDRHTKQGEEKQTDFPNIVVFGKQAERLNIDDALSQAGRDARGGEIPMVFHRSNRTPWKVTMRLDDFVSLWKEAKREGR